MLSLCVSVCQYSLMSGGTLCPPGVRHHTRATYWEIFLPVIHTYTLAFYTLHSLRGPQGPHTTFIPGVFQVLKKSETLICSYISSFKKSRFSFLKCICGCIYRISCVCLFENFFYGFLQQLQHYIKLKYSWSFHYFHVQWTRGFIDNLLQEGFYVLRSIWSHFMAHWALEGLGWVNEAGLLCQRWFGLLSVVELQIYWRPKLTALIEWESQ